MLESSNAWCLENANAVDMIHANTVSELFKLARSAARQGTTVLPLRGLACLAAWVISTVGGAVTNLIMQNVWLWNRFDLGISRVVKELPIVGISEEQLIVIVAVGWRSSLGVDINSGGAALRVIGEEPAISVAKGANDSTSLDRNASKL